MVANTNNALLFLITSLLDLALCAFLLRVLLQLSRSDFYNPISQLVWRVTQPVVGPLSKAIPRWQRLDLAASLVLLLIALVYVEVVAGLIQYNPGWLSALWFALLKIASLALNLYTLSLFALALLSWVGPGVSNPAANVLWSLNEPLLRPVRRILPPIGGLDLSPVPVMLLLQFVDRLLPLGPFR
ncbi:MAG: YggT family protein [Nevskia sp.]|nr:YggT family protein [Nevskia sp.]